MKLLLVLCTCALAAAYDKADKDASIKEVTDAGFPPLNAFTHAAFPPKTLSNFLKKELAMLSAPLEHTSKLQMEAIFATVSAANVCEICLSFHAMGMSKEENPATQDDIETIVNGGVPKDERLAGVVTTAKYVLAHKGIFLPREKQHLESAFGIGAEQRLEIVYLVGAIEANNRLMVHLLSEGVELEDFLQPFTPFKNTVYAKKEEL